MKVAPTLFVWVSRAATFEGSPSPVGLPERLASRGPEFESSGVSVRTVVVEVPKAVCYILTVIVGGSTNVDPAIE